MSVQQADFTEGLFDPSRPAPDGVVNPGGEAATRRYDVYRNNVAVSLSEALETAFPVIRKLLGEQFFKAMAGVYLRLHRPSSPLMMFYGEHMPQFLSRFEPVKKYPYLADVARLELAMRHAYHAADAAPLAADRLGAVAPEELMAVRFTFAPAVHVLRSDYPIYSIYRANTDPAAPKPQMQAEAVLITRLQFDPQQHLIDGPAATCIETLMEGEPLGVAMTRAGNDLDLGAVLGLLLAQGALTDLKT